MPQTRKLVSITAREMDILQLLAKGGSYASIAASLGVSAHTVASHVKKVYVKLGVHTAAHAVMRAVELRLLVIDPKK